MLIPSVCLWQQPVIISLKYKTWSAYREALCNCCWLGNELRVAVFRSPPVLSGRTEVYWTTAHAGSRCAVISWTERSVLGNEGLKETIQVLAQRKNSAPTVPCTGLRIVSSWLPIHIAVLCKDVWLAAVLLWKSTHRTRLNYGFFNRTTCFGIGWAILRIAVNFKTTQGGKMYI